ncbi:MAG: glycosyltransferase family 39 protein [Phycisphaerae bacterium]|nr:glycosyltransferase family 39 protein [Phycisphaerae bacterium]MCZ2401597.1 glycosyltransferase family 39 protein [Phycisphaerae bacterium]
MNAGPTPPAADRPARLPPSTTPLWLHLLAVGLVAVPLVVLSQLAAHWRVDVVDDQLFGYFGWRIAHGATVYVELWDNKPPGIYWINALGFLISGDSYNGVIALCALAIVVSLAAFFVIGASIYHRGAAAIATIVAAFFITHGYFQAGANRTETFLIAFELAAVALYFRGFAKDRWWCWYVAGLCCGGAFLFKQVGLAAWGAMGLHTIVLVAMRELSWPAGLRRGLLLAGGAATTILAAVVALAAQGALDAAWYAVFTFNRAYFEAGNSSFSNTYANRYFLRQHMFPILLLPVLMAIAAVIHAVLWWLRPLTRPADVERGLREARPVCSQYMLLFVVWYAVALYGAIVSPHFFRHYLVPSLPPLLLIGGYLINVLKTEAALLRRMQQRIAVTAAFVLMGYLAWSAYWRQLAELSSVWVYRFEQGKNADWEDVAWHLAQVTRNDDLVQCFDYLPGVYLHARRINATRYVTMEKIGQLEKTQTAEMIRQYLIHELDRIRPPALVMHSGDYVEMEHQLSAAEPDPTRRPIDSLGRWLLPFLRDHYRLAVDVADHGVYIFLRNDRWPEDRAPLIVRGRRPSDYAR